MEMLAAMMAGAFGGVLLRAISARARSRWPATTIGILGGLGAWWVVDRLGPVDAAGPLVIWHAAAGAIGGAALVAAVAVVASRTRK